MSTKKVSVVFYLLTNFLVGLDSSVYAQAGNFSTADTTEMILGYPDLETQLYPLDSIVKVAIINSPYVKSDSATIEAHKINVTLAKRNYQNYISAFGNYSFGNQQFLIQDGTHSNTFSNGYRYGLNVSIPLGMITNRGLQIQRSKMEVDALMQKKEQTKMGLARQVAAEYNSLIAAQKMLKIKSENVENFRVMRQMAEKQFREGTITLEDFAFVSDMTMKAEVDYELARSNFRSVYQQFESLVGVKLTTLMRGK